MKKLLFIFLSFLLAFPVLAQKELRSPEEFLGYPLGEHFTNHHRVVDYFKYVATNSPKVKLQEYGTTYEGRPLLVALVGTEKNLKRLEEIRSSNLIRTGLFEGKKEKDKTAIVWLSYNVHGNEAVSTEAAMAVLHSLAYGGNEQANEWLENTLVIIDPVVNPDGRDHYVNWYTQVKNLMPNPEPNAIEHHEPWPGGRPNHYLFDLNRDWAWQTQKESQQRMALYNQWLPHIHADFHEQGIESPYYFAPAAEPFHAYITNWQREFQTEIGLNNAKYFDENAWLYFTREMFDLLYPSYGDTYPTFNGAIGMTYEQGGSGKAGLAVLTKEEDTLKLNDRVLHHYTTSLSTIEATSQNARRVVENFESFFLKSSENPPGKYKSYLIPAQNGSDKISSLRKFLTTHQISFKEASEQKNMKGWSYKDAKKTSFYSKPGDLVISAYQPKAVLLQVLFEPSSSLRDSLTYDITAWSVPYMMGLEAYATEEKIKAKEPKDLRNFTINLGAEKPYAYLLDWQGIEDTKFLSSLLKEGVKFRFAEEAFVINNINYGAGTLIITRKGNETLGSRFDVLVREAANEWERPVKTVNTGFVAEGKDFGSNSIRYLKAPKVAVLAGEDVSSLAFGEVWHYFEQQINYPLTVIRTDYFNKIDLHNYDVLILPSGSYSKGLRGKIPDNLLEWVSKGGKLILMQDAISSFKSRSKNSLELTHKQKENSSEREEKQSELREYGNREREAISGYNPGSIFTVKLDHSHPLAFGYQGDYFSLKTDSKAYHYLESGWNVGTIRSEDALISGFVGNEIKEDLAASLVFGVEENGEGQIIYMVDNPLFRAFWENGKLLFSNAIFFVGQ